LTAILILYYEPQASGQTTHVLSLAQGLDSSRWRVTVVLPDHLTGPVRNLRESGVDVRPIPMGKLMWNPSALLSLVRWIRDAGFDVVHVHSQEAGLWARIVARVAGAPAIVYTPQTVNIRRARWHGLYALTERALALVTDVIISVNDLDRGRLIGWGIPSQKVVTIPNGIDVRKFEGPIDAAGLRTTLGLDPGRPVVMQVGRLSPQKDPLAFVDGASQVVRVFPEAQFALLGDGPLRDAVAEEIRRYGLEHHVRMLGWHENAFRAIAAADVVTLTSRWEGAPYALLEAMAWSRPVVATAVNGCPEIVVDSRTGFLTPPGDTAEWARRVAALLSDPAKARTMGQNGRVRIQEEFDLPKTIASVEKVYSSASYRPE
jgi:glycosyltransferase involved in cell wall biosynthesis